MSNSVEYNPNTPLVDTPFADWQPAFLQNFQQLYAAFAQNHIPLDAASNAGIHTIIQLTEQEMSQQTNVSEISVYTKKVGDQTDQIFIRYQGNGQEFQYTNYQIYSLAVGPRTPTTFFTFLPGQIICYFGIATSFIWPLFPAIAKNIISVNLTPIGASPQPQFSASFGADSQTGIIQNLFLNSTTRTTNLYYFILANL